MRKVNIGSVIGYLLCLILLIGLIGSIAYFSDGFKDWNVKDWFTSEVKTDVYTGDDEDNNHGNSGNNNDDTNHGGNHGNSNNDDEYTDIETQTQYKKLITKDTSVNCAFWQSENISDPMVGTYYSVGWYEYYHHTHGEENDVKFECFESTNDYYVAKNDLYGSIYTYTKSEWDVSFTTTWDYLTLVHYNSASTYNVERDARIVFSITKNVSLDGVSLKGVYISIPFDLNTTTTIDFDMLPDYTFIEWANDRYSVYEFKSFLNQNGYATNLSNFIFRYADKCDLRIPHGARYYFTDLVLSKAV